MRTILLLTVCGLFCASCFYSTPREYQGMEWIGAHGKREYHIFEQGGGYAGFVFIDGKRFDVTNPTYRKGIFNGIVQIDGTPEAVTLRYDSYKGSDADTIVWATEDSSGERIEFRQKP